MVPKALTLVVLVGLATAETSVISLFLPDTDPQPLVGSIVKEVCAAHDPKECCLDRTGRWNYHVQYCLRSRHGFVGLRPWPRFAFHRGPINGGMGID